MEIEVKDVGARTVMLLTGRLDVTWAEHVLQRAQELIRGGRHQLRVNASGVDYLSSAGIRVLIRIQKELKTVHGQLLVLNPSPFVENALVMSGLGQLIASMEEAGYVAETSRLGGDQGRGEPGQDAPGTGGVAGASCSGMEGARMKPGQDAPGTSGGTGGVAGASCSGSLVELYPVEPGGTMCLQISAGWRPWRVVQDADIRKVVFAPNAIGLGIGAQGVDAADARQRLGEFVAVPGGLTWMPSDGNKMPDYALQTGKLVPDIFAIQAWVAEGTFSHLLRFQPAAAGDVMSLSCLIAQALAVTGADAVALVCLAEIDGLVGASLARSPGLLAGTDAPGRFPDVREWMTFCGERVHARQSALLVSFAARESATEGQSTLPPLPTLPGVRAHTHAAVLPFRPLKAGEMDVAQTVQMFFASAEPLDLLHLITDDRPVMGLGESAFVRGACWFAPLECGKENPL
jgi:anti-anti-sigma factor